MAVKGQQAIDFLKKSLGEDAFEEIKKFEIIVENTQTAIDPQEIRVALQIVPRAILAFLQKELGEMQPGAVKEVKIPSKENCFLSINKTGHQVYTGEIREGGRVISRFSHRTLPSVGLMIMTTFEMYDETSVKQSAAMPDDLSFKVQQIIESRMAFRDTIERVVDKKLSEREAVEALVKRRLTEILSMPKEKAPKEVEKKSKLKAFLEKRKTKASGPSYSVSLTKNESVKCPDCGQDIFSSSGFTGCLCYGDDRESKLFLKKTESGVNISFPKSWDAENIKMLLEALRARNGRK
jgi:hypothetical protein